MCAPGSAQFFTLVKNETFSDHFFNPLNMIKSQWCTLKQGFCTKSCQDMRGKIHKTYILQPFFCKNFTILESFVKLSKNVRTYNTYNVLSNLENGLLFTVTFLHLQFFLLSSLFVVVFQVQERCLKPQFLSKKVWCFNLKNRSSLLIR